MLGMIPWWGVLPLLAVLLFAIACGVYYWVVVFRIVRGRRMLPTARAGLRMDDPAGGWPSVAVVIPAHNESDVIVKAARTVLMSSYPGELSVVFALDRCTDDTEVLLRGVISDLGEMGERAEVVLINDCPEGWAGKVHAIHFGVTRSERAQSADLLLFADADTGFDPGLVRSTVAILKDRGLSLLSLLSTLTVGEWFERLVQPAAGFELVRQYPLDQVNSTERGRAFANGQFMLFERSAYEAVGGHEGVRDELLEDLAFSRLVKKPGSGRAIGCLEADGMLECQMYRSWDSFRTGWKRIYTEAARRRPARLRKNASRLVLTAVWLPLAAVLGVVVGFLSGWVWGFESSLVRALLVAGSVGVAGYFVAMGLVYSAQRLGVWRVVTYPTGALKVASIMREAAHDLDTGAGTEWGGKTYAREVRA